ncbi:hypothetical protein [Peptostreptococcus equinus]|uniref:Phage transcriptional regulator, RinA family n=1 Tax=Peptostreptococcus equinus TaxID=3003601 RepID=A0ABY7JS02_9FIRM|nr:hypothetical protein [Peptostreptococcus sp. CBA3647]WAW14760.1 hypothetical protein O0R46_09265 [Peptostreptococcus sp. CBA3647]
MRIQKQYYKKTLNLLETYNSIKKHIENLEITQLEIKEYKSRDIKCIATDGVRVGLVDPDKIGNNLIRVEDMIYLTNKELVSEKNTIKMIDDAIDLLESDEQYIIRKLFIENKTPIQISCESRYDEPKIYRLRRAALNKIAICIHGYKAMESKKV